VKPKLYQYPKCSTCRKAIQFLDQQEVDYESIDIVERTPSKTELTRIMRLSGVALKRLFNTSGQSYREGCFGARLAGMSESDALDALARDGKLIKRPLILGKDFALVGFDAAAYRQYFP
jgi:arsenate reductase (glutaredoxin)